MRASDTQQVRRERDTAATQDRHHVSRGPLIERSNLFSNITQCFYIWSRLPNGRKSPQKNTAKRWQLEEASTHKSVLTHAGNVLPLAVCPSRIGRGQATKGKPGVAGMACAMKIAAGKTQRGLRTHPAAILRSV